MLFKHDPEIGIDLGIGERLDALGAPHRIDVTKSYDIGTRFGGAGHICGPLSPYPDSRDVYAFIGPPHARGQKLKSEG